MLDSGRRLDRAKRVAVCVMSVSEVLLSAVRESRNDSYPLMRSIQFYGAILTYWAGEFKIIVPKV